MKIYGTRKTVIYGITVCRDMSSITDSVKQKKKRKNLGSLDSGKLLQSFPVSRVKIIQDGGLAGLEHMVIVCHMFL